MPRLSDLFTPRQIAWMWFVLNVLKTIAGVLIASPVTSGANASAAEWWKAGLGALIALWGVFDAVTKEDPLAMAPVSVDGIGEPKP